MADRGVRPHFEKLATLAGELNATGRGPHPNGSYEVWVQQRAALAAQVNAEAVFALDELWLVIAERLEAFA